MKGQLKFMHVQAFFIFTLHPFKAHLGCMRLEIFNEKYCKTNNNNNIALKPHKQNISLFVHKVICKKKFYFFFFMFSLSYLVYKMNFIDLTKYIFLNQLYKLC